MKVTVEVSDAELREIRTMTGEMKKGPAIRQVLIDALTLHRRRQTTQRFQSGDWAIDFPHFESRRKQDRLRDTRRQRNAGN